MGETPEEVQEFAKILEHCGYVSAISVSPTAWLLYSLPAPDRLALAAALAGPELMVDQIVSLDVGKREALLGELGEIICMHCYRDHPLHGICQCWNDE